MIATIALRSDVQPTTNARAASKPSTRFADDLQAAVASSDLVTQPPSAPVAPTPAAASQQLGADLAPAALPAEAEAAAIDDTTDATLATFATGFVSPLPTPTTPAAAGDAAIAEPVVPTPVVAAPVVAETVVTDTVVNSKFAGAEVGTAEAKADKVAADGQQRPAAALSIQQRLQPRLVSNAITSAAAEQAVAGRLGVASENTRDATTEPTEQVAISDRIVNPGQCSCCSRGPTTATSVGNPAPTSSRAAGASTPTDSPRSTAPAPATSNPSLGMIGIERVQMARANAPARELQRLAIELDQARVAVSFGHDQVKVSVVSDPSDVLNSGWARQMERTLNNAVRAGGDNATPSRHDSRDADQHRPDRDRPQQFKEHRSADFRSLLAMEGDVRW